MILGALTLDELLAAARRMNASDLHLAPLERPRLRCDGSLRQVDETILGANEFSQMIEQLFGTSPELLLHEHTDVDRAVEHERYGRLRLHAFQGQGRCRLSIRLLAERVADPQELGLPQALVDLFERDQLSHGLVLIAGATGQGKTTVLASLLEQINIRRNVHIVTIEDPIEYRIQARAAHISQREIKTDVHSFADGIHAAMRMDLDVLAIGELREPQAIAAALRAAETGHLVLATVHGTDCVASLERIVDAFDDGKAAIRTALAGALRAVVALRLLPKAREDGRVLASELLVATDSIRALIRENKTHHVRNAIATGRAFGMHTFEYALRRLLADGTIDERTARAASAHPDELFSTSAFA